VLRAGVVALALLGGGGILTRSAWPNPPGAEEDGALPPNASLEQVVEKIRREKVVSSEHVGFAGRPSSVYAAFKRLSQVASEADLGRFTNDRSPALRVYAFNALADLLQALWKIDEPRALRDLERSFQNANDYSDYSLLPLLVRFVRDVGQLRDPSSLPLLFDRLETRGKDGRVIVEA